MSRSFTYIDDVAEIIKLFINKPAKGEKFLIQKTKLFD